MKGLLRFHLYRSVTAKAVRQKGGPQIRVNVRGPDRPSGLPLDVVCYDEAEAKREGDDLVQQCFPHECNPKRCGLWE